MRIDRRGFLELLALSGASLALAPAHGLAQPAPLITKLIPSSRTRLPAIGMGTWITFNVGENPKLRDARTEVLREFFAKGGSLIDSSPMYGSSEAVVGHCLAKLGHPRQAFAATKVWTSSASEGLEQIKSSQRLWGIQKFELFQVHNLEGWQDHLKTLFKMKAEGALKYVGVTTSHGRRHDELEQIMRAQPLDFVQLTYSLADREAEKRLLGVAAERGIAVIANRPFDGGDLVKRFAKKPLPPWAGEIDCANWPQFLLKYVVSHPAITCAIPATTSVVHMRENMGACTGRLPDAALRERMASYASSL